MINVLIKSGEHEACRSYCSVTTDRSSSVRARICGRARYQCWQQKQCGGEQRQNHEDLATTCRLHYQSTFADPRLLAGSRPCYIIINTRKGGYSLGFTHGLLRICFEATSEQESKTLRCRHGVWGLSRIRRGSQVAKAEACKAFFGGSIPPRASTLSPSCILHH